jgi:translation initiation factor 2 beta subunit (eIF-2beta)/eIF-5
MSIDEIPKAILERTQQMSEIVQVLDAHREGRSVDVRCRICGTPVALVEVEATNTLLVSCEKGCTRLRAQRAKP